MKIVVWIDKVLELIAIESIKSAYKIYQQNANVTHVQYFKIRTPSFGYSSSGISDEHPRLSWRFIISISTENTAASSGSSQAMNASLECIFASFASFSPYFWSSFLMNLDDRVHYSHKDILNFAEKNNIYALQCDFKNMFIIATKS